MDTPHQVAERFRRLDFHDDTLVDMTIFPPQPRGKDGRRRGRGESSIVEIRLFRYWENTLRTIRFSGCANLQIAMDFDVLADHVPPNTARVGAHADLDAIEALVLSQERESVVLYQPESSSPLYAKLEKLGELISFRVQFFGGAVEVLARRYRVMKASTPSIARRVVGQRRRVSAAARAKR